VSRVVLTDEARDDLRNLDGSARKLVLRALRKLEDAPESRGAPLGSRRTDNLTGFRKLVVGDRQYRVVYRVEADGTVCVIWVIGSRVDEECYRLAVARLETHTGGPAVREMSALLGTLWQSTSRRTDR
jgi:mRNA interferase RelE/StbE